MSFVVARQNGRLLREDAWNCQTGLRLIVQKSREPVLIETSTKSRCNGPSFHPSAVVAIPIRNERDRIVACLSSLAAQVGIEPGSLGIVLFANNCTDDTCELVRAFPSMPWPLRLIEMTDPAASAGWARRIAMEAAADWLVEGGHADGVLLTTDADTRVGVDWVARNRKRLAEGADAVAGRISLEPREAALLPTRLHARGRLEAEYEAILTEIGHWLDPEPGNPWPCHWSKSGATLAVRLWAYREIGGMPDQPAGEDRAFVDALRARDLVVRHDPAIEVVTSRPSRRPRGWRRRRYDPAAVRHSRQPLRRSA